MEIFMTNETVSRYVPCPSDIYLDWSGHQCEDFKPTDRQLICIEAVQSALDANLFYTTDMVAHCKAYLGVTPEQAASNRSKVEGGDCGYDFYYARSYLKAQFGHQADRSSIERLKPYVGQVLGTLVFGDFKRTTGMVVTEVCEGGKLITATGKRGSYGVVLKCTARQIENAMDRAFERKSRKTDSNAFAENCSGCGL